jgi:hypothetical protein
MRPPSRADADEIQGPSRCTSVRPNVTHAADRPCATSAALLRERQDRRDTSALRIPHGRRPRSHRRRTPAEQVSAPSPPLNRSQARAGVGRENGPAPPRGCASPHTGWQVIETPDVEEHAVDGSIRDLFSDCTHGRPQIVNI